MFRPITKYTGKNRNQNNELQVYTQHSYIFQVIINVINQLVINQLGSCFVNIITGIQTFAALRR